MKKLSKNAFEPLDKYEVELIKAFGAEKQILAIEKGLAKKLKQAEVSFEEMYKHQPFRQNEILQEKLIEAVRIRHQEFLSNAKNI